MRSVKRNNVRNSQYENVAYETPGHTYSTVQSEASAPAVSVLPKAPPARSTSTDRDVTLVENDLYE